MKLLKAHWDLLLLSSCIVFFNLPLLTGLPAAQFIFSAEAVRAGEWWRIFTHPFVHVSLYHLALDAGAFLLLYQGLKKHALPQRLLLTAASGGGSLLLTMLTPAIQQAGLCGLSGTAHGLMTISALDMLRTPGERKIGWLALILVVGKSIFEAATGNVFLASLHLGYIGSPQAWCHLGGVLGALVVYGLLSSVQNNKQAGA